MEKRYQVFVSSTYADLKNERQAVMQALMEMDCIPAGMEMFPAADEEQLTFIKKVIDDCDYYLLIIGGRYGSVTDEGISYTEQEYDYAVSKGVKVVALIHDKPDELAASRTDIDPVLREKLEAFRVKVKTGRLVKSWTRTEELPGLVALSLSKTIKMYPAIGWVRANAIASEDILSQLNQVRQENESLRSELASARSDSEFRVNDLAGLDEFFNVLVHYQPSTSNHRSFLVQVPLTWGEIFSHISPYIADKQGEHEEDIQNRINTLISNKLANTRLIGCNLWIDYEYFKTIEIQLKALDLIAVHQVRWTATPKGEKTMYQIRAVRSQPKPESNPIPLIITAPPPIDLSDVDNDLPF